MERYEEVPHTADLAARVFGRDLEGLFANAAFAMFDMMGQSSVVSRPSSEKVNVEVQAPDKESLLISFLNEILYVSYIKKVFLKEFNFLEFSENSLKAVISGCLKGDARLKHEIKAATYHDVRIQKTADGYETMIVFDV
jgi:SHS2 domain-containing protein